MKYGNVAVLDDCEQARTLALALGLPTTGSKSDYELVLRYECGVLSLCLGEMKLFGDFSETGKRLKKSNLKTEALIKACRIKGESGFLVVDATAGLGEDSFLLAADGFSIEMFEYNPLISALLENAMERGKNEGYRNILERMTLHFENSITALKGLEYAPDIVYLDPMFPKRQKSSLIKKKFQVLWHLEEPCVDEEELLNAAISANPIKIVIKRPLKADSLAGYKPSYSIKGSTIRYDCIVLR